MKYAFKGGTVDPQPIWFYQRTMSSGRKTPLLMGMARGGTSALAAVVDALGVHVGETNDGHFETWEFKADFETDGAVDDLKNKIAEYNEQYEAWGAQVWANVAGVRLISSLVENPCIIAIVRDSAAVTQAHLVTKEYGDNPRDILESVREVRKNILEIVEEVGIPSLLVSFERLRVQSWQTVAMIAEFLHVFPDDDQFEDAVARVNHGGGYLVRPRGNEH